MPPSFETDSPYTPIHDFDESQDLIQTAKYTPPPRSSHVVSSSEFPISSGEAGTAIFGIDQLQKQNPNISTQRPKAPQPFGIQISTPQQTFKGKVESFDHKEIVVHCKESLIRGEEVKLKFTLPITQHQIDCRALVRLASSSDDGLSFTCRFLDLRLQQEQMISEEFSNS